MNEATLNLLLADHQVLYQKLRGYHWTVTGPLFFGLHQKFEELYDAAALHVDALAERIAALGGQPITTMKQGLELTRLEEDAGRPTPEEMVRSIAGDLDRLNGWLREAAGQAEKENDRASANLCDEMADAHEKAAWMLKAFLAA